MEQWHEEPGSLGHFVFAIRYVGGEQIIFPSIYSAPMVRVVISG